MSAVKLETPADLSMSSFEMACEKCSTVHTAFMTLVVPESLLDVANEIKKATDCDLLVLPTDLFANKRCWFVLDDVTLRAVISVPTP